MNDLKNLNYGKFQDSKEIIDISLEFIISNKYEYGPDFEEKEKNYSDNLRVGIRTDEFNNWGLKFQ